MIVCLNFAEDFQPKKWQSRTPRWDITPHTCRATTPFPEGLV